MYPLIITGIATLVCFLAAIYFACETLVRYNTMNLVCSVILMLFSLSSLTFLFQRL